MKFLKKMPKIVVLVLGLVVAYLLVTMTCGGKKMMYSPIEITPKSNGTFGDLTRDARCLPGSGEEGESSHSEGLGPRGVCGLHGFVRDQHDYEITGGIGTD